MRTPEPTMIYKWVRGEHNMRLNAGDLRLYQDHLIAKFGRPVGGEESGTPITVAGDQDIHVDYGNNTLLVPPRQSGPEVVACLCYYSDIEEAGGATHFVKAKAGELTRYSPESFNPPNFVFGTKNGSASTIDGPRSEVLTEEITFIDKKNIAILSGPNLAKEIYENKTTSTVIASSNLNLLRNIKTIIESNKFKIYLSEDTIGVELGGALKNIVTLGAGICDGLNIGNNLKGAFISIAFSEIVKLALSAGAQSVTISGLSGLGDILASSYSPLSRNRLAGQYLSEGYSINDINKKINNIVEGIDTLYGAKALSKKLNINHTFIDLMIDVFNQKKHPNELLKNTIGNI